MVLNTRSSIKFAVVALTVVLLPVWKSNVLWDVLSTGCENVIILVLVPPGRDAEFGHLNLCITESPVRDSSVPQPYKSTIHEVFAPAV